ncbi:MAG: C25 family cysteine peptidase [Cytophagaceae bacterium]|jgi:PKD repeat protein|nr:C25 family cysteine peptidase [Cytophagaceae bacterium]
MKKLLFTLFATALFTTVGFAQHKQTIHLSSKASGMKLKSVQQEQFSIQNSINELILRNTASGNGNFSLLEIEGATNPSNTGKASLPVFSHLIEVPAGAEIEVEINYYTEENIRLNDYGVDVIMPTQPSYSKSTPQSEMKFVIDEVYYNTNRFDDEPLVKTEITGTMRGTRFGRIEVRPYHYNPVENTLIVYNDLDFTVKFKNADFAETQRLKSLYQAKEFDGMFKNFLNYQPDASKDGFSNYQKPLKYVIVANRMFEETLQPFVEWKTQMGFNVIEAYTDEVGTTNTAIKAYLQGLYDAATPDDPAPLYLLIVGDHNGTGAIPAFNGRVSYPDNNHITDLYFVTFDGTSDFLPDMYIGRMSANTVTELENILDKTIPYERYEFPDDSFLNKVVLIAGVDSYWAPIDANAHISYATRLYYNEEHGYSDIFAYYYNYNGPYNVMSSNNNGAAADISNKISTGVGFANYTAHGFEPGWGDPSITNSNIPLWNNENKYAFMIGNCCLTFRFNYDDCFGEKVLNTAKKGAIAYIGGTNNTYWGEDIKWAIGVQSLSLSAANVPNHNYDNTGFGALDAIWHEHNEPYENWAVNAGQITMRGNLAINGSSSSYKHYYWEIYAISGDPSLTPYNGIPAELAMDYNMPMTGDIELVITTEPYTYVAISQDGVLLDTKWSGEQNTVTLTFDHLAETAITIVATKQNRKPYINEFTPLPPVEPTAAFSASATNIIRGDTIHFTDESEYGFTYLWNFGDDSTSTEQNPSHLFTTVGTFNVSLTVTNTLGSDTETKEITVNENTNPPAVNFVADTTRFDAGLTVNFTDNSLNFPESWEWTFEGGVPASSTEQNPAVLYNTPGIYNVTLKATNQYGEDTQTKTGYIVVNVPPIIMADGSTIACGTTFMDPGGEGRYPNKQNIVHTIYPATSEAQVMVTFLMIDIEGSISTCYDYLEIYNGESVEAELIGSFCGQNPAAVGNNGVVIANNPTGALTFKFYSDSSTPGDGWLADVSCYIHTDVPIVDFEIVSGELCGGVVNFVNKSTFADAYEWDFGDGNTSNKVNPTHQYAETGNYTVTLNAINAIGAYEATKTVAIESTGGISVETSVTDATNEDTADGAIELTVTGGTAPYTIVWTNYQDNSETLNELLPGVYEVKITDANNCYVTMQITVGVTISIRREELQFKVVPNPAKDYVAVNFENKKVLKIELFNMTGELLLRNVPAGNRAVLNLSKYPAGIYFINLICEDEVKAVKVQVVK